MTKLLLGRLKKDAGTYADGQNIYIEKHRWECKWYWEFGYIGNINCHFHFNSLLDGHKLASELFSETLISDTDWWIIRDLFKQAYSLKATAAVYRHGGHQTTMKGVTDIIKDDVMVKRLNHDLQVVLDAVWEFIVQASAEKYE